MVQYRKTFTCHLTDDPKENHPVKLREISASIINSNMSNSKARRNTRLKMPMPRLDLFKEEKLKRNTLLVQ